MSSSSVAYISATELAREWKKRGCKQGDWAIVDVRDDDFEGGHIRGCWNVPSTQFDSRLSEVVATLKDASKVVFHCSLSQSRGPKAARIYNDARKKAIDNGKIPDREQSISILRDGFSGFGVTYKDDKDLVEGYDEESWKYR